MFADHNRDTDTEGGDLGQRQIDKNYTPLHHVQTEVNQNAGKQDQRQQRPQPECEQFHKPFPRDSSLRRKQQALRRWR